MYNVMVVGCCTQCRKHQMRHLRTAAMSAKAMYLASLNSLYLPSSTHQLPASGNFVDDKGNASKLLCVENYKIIIGFIDMSDMMAKNYSISRKVWKGTKRIVLPPSRLHNPQFLYSSFLMWEYTRP
jgi:hypothetical protein